MLLKNVFHKVGKKIIGEKSVTVYLTYSINVDPNNFGNELRMMMVNENILKLLIYSLTTFFFPMTH